MGECYSSVASIWRFGQKLAESFLVDAFVVSFFRRDARVPEVLQDRVVQRLVAFFLTDLKHAGDLVRFSFAHEIGDRGVDHQNLKSRDAPWFVDALEKVLRDHAL